jgi:hypothetical protein
MNDDLNSPKEEKPEKTHHQPKVNRLMPSYPIINIPPETLNYRAG